MDFVSNKAHFTSYNATFRKNILCIAQKCEELHEMPLEFIEKLEQLIFLDKEEGLGEKERKILEGVYKNNPLHFLICHQLWQKFGPEFVFLGKTTMTFAILYETNKGKSLMKEIKKLTFLNAKVTVLTKTYL